ncbi:MAG TPA: TonB-dependent receptor [Bacteroidetes bacterium]|nr:TonB-dependent receptor [Bacteroidota bacterium]
MKLNYPAVFLFFSILFFSTNIFSQKNSLSGAVTDSTGIGLPAASLALMQAKDSVLVSFGITDNEGRFELKKIPAGEYLLQVTYIGYETYWQLVHISENTGKLNIGRIIIAPASKTLIEAEVIGEHIPLRMRNDTLEYNANAFKTQPGSVVEDLLKKLPGIEVERDGTIKAQGEAVQNVFVDGKEFFGNDPKIATKNLPADAVEKVQVYDKKSDMAEFTGIEDGRDTKSINLELKDGKKKGYFGNASAGSGALENQNGDLEYDRYEGKFNINRFSGKSQISTIGLLNNTNQQGFSFNEYIRFMGGLSNFLSGSGGSGGRSFSFDPSAIGIPMQGAGLGQGFTKTSAVGLNLNHEFNKKTELNASYFYSNIENNIDRSATKESILDAGSFTNNETEKRISKNQNHKLNTTLRHKIDSFQNIVLRTNLGFNNAQLNSDGSANTSDGLNILQNKNNREYGAKSENFSLSSNLTYRRRFRQKGRAFVANASWGMENEDRKGSLKSNNIFYENNQINTEENTDQKQVFTDDATDYGISLTYTEPIGKALKKKAQYLAFSASRQNFNNNTQKDFFDKINNTETLNPGLSNRYDREYIYDRGGLKMMVNRKKYNLTFGADVQHSKLTGNLLDENMRLKKDFARILPSLFWDYEIATSRNFSIEYTTSIREPSLEQLQPIVDNSDPLNIYAGNPALRPEYMHLLNGRFMLFDQFSFTSLFANISASYTKSPITNSSSIDSLFRQFIQPVNVDHDYNIRGGFQFKTPLRAIHTNIRLNYSANWNRGFLFVNNIENNVERQRHSISLSLDNRKKDVIDFTIGGRISFNKTTYSEAEQLSQHYIDQKFYSDLVVLPTDKWEISSSIDYSIYSAETFGSKRAIPIWKASISRYILKNKKGKLSLSGYDILNKNIGINRSSQLNFVQEERIRSLGRHIMLNFAYSISGFKKDSGGIEISVENER